MIPVYSTEDLAKKIDALRKPWHANYLAMYSSLYGGIVTDPVLMTLPVDDHLVHRADGVFDVFKCVNGKAYSMEEHLVRLNGSAGRIDLKFPPEFENIRDIIKQTVRVGAYPDVMVRIIVSRGSGGFSTNPYECPVSHLYVIVTKLKSPSMEDYQNGVSIISAPVPVKPPMFANIKSCDYLGNVLVKKAAIEAGVQFAVNWDENGHLAEGSTENIMLVSPDRELLIPDFGRVLKGVTATRVAELAETLVRKGELKAVKEDQIDREAAAACPEAMLTGTSLDVLPVTKWDGKPVGDGKVGPVTNMLMSLIREDTISNNELLTDMFE